MNDRAHNNRNLAILTLLGALVTAAFSLAVGDASAPGVLSAESATTHEPAYDPVAADPFRSLRVEEVAE